MSEKDKITTKGIRKLKIERATIQDKLDEIQKKDRGGTTSWGGSFEKERLQNELYVLHERLREIDESLENAKVFDEQIATDEIGFGTKATLLINKEEMVYTFMGEAESDPSQNIVSINSPLGKALFGKKEGDVVNVELPAGNLTVTIFEVHDPQE